jgi:RNA polymerase sigma-70 factor (ECF subfamily)
MNVTSTAAARPKQVESVVDHLFRERAGQMVSYLARLLGPEHLELAEEVVQDALVKALQHWPYSGIPDNPGAWLFQVARNAALDAVRHDAVLNDKTPAIVAEIERADPARTQPADFQSELQDDELRMLFMCCHPRLSRNACVPLSLKIVGGFGVQEIARALLADATTIAQRIVRAKRQMRDERITLDLPRAGELPERLNAVLEVIYLIFNEGYAAASGEDLIRIEFCREALRLARLVAESALSAPRVHALVALIAFQAARLPARIDSKGELVLLEDQDRSLWDRRLIALAFRHFERSAEGDEISEYHLQAAIAATHARLDGAPTDWAAILELYDQLVTINPSPVVLLNRAVVIARIGGARAGLVEVDDVGQDARLRNYYLLHSVRGRLLLELGERTLAAECFRAALKCHCSEPERRFIAGKLREAVHHGDTEDTEKSEGRRNTEN